MKAGNGIDILKVFTFYSKMSKRLSWASSCRDNETFKLLMVGGKVEENESDKLNFNEKKSIVLYIRRMRQRC